MLARFREPALTASTLLAPLVGVILLFTTNLTPEVQALWNGLATAVAGLITAGLVAREKLVPAILGFAQTVMQFLGVYGFHLTTDQITGVMGFLSLALGLYMRTQVWAGVATDGTPREPAELRAA